MTTLFDTLLGTLNPSYPDYQSFEKACSACEKCSLRDEPQVSKVVISAGSPTAKLMFVGEAPGLNEDKDGEPFTGRSDQLLRQVISRMGLGMDSVYLCNVVKCRPSNNRDPEPHEVEACTPWLEEQIAQVKPEVIVTLGRFSTVHLLSLSNEGQPRKFTMTRARGQTFIVNGIKVIPTWHPAYILRNPAAKTEFWSDLCKVCNELGIVPLNQK